MQDYIKFVVVVRLLQATFKTKSVVEKRVSMDVNPPYCQKRQTLLICLQTRKYLEHPMLQYIQGDRIKHSMSQKFFVETTFHLQQQFVDRHT